MDRKLETFLTVCRTMNYRKAAEQLHLTQPAVTKQIQALEAQYGVKLFDYDGRRLSKTEKGRLLEVHAISQQVMDEDLMRAMRETPRTLLRVGATKTIGDYILPHDVRRFLENPAHELSFVVDNTVHLLAMLEANELDFVFLEGNFDKQRYDFHLLRNEPFLGICAPDHPLNGRNVNVTELFGETLILREAGSGTRDIFERGLHQLSYSTRAFRKTVFISSFKLIRELVGAGCGISFAYEAIANEYPQLGRFYCEPITGMHELNVVYLKNTHAREAARAFTAL